ncbi:MAG TPA: sensor histidine kinase, partial [Actinomycetota bacterium]|nr:sensor histidine kinase [Actinomycetota bacterium]
EAERQRIAGDVHDGPIQLLTAAGLGLEMVRKSLAKLGQRDMNERIEEALAALTRAVEGMRTLTFDLRPSSLDEQGLASALREYLQYRDPDLRFVVEDRLHGQPPEAIRLILFRVAQEALANVRKHAKATRVDVLISERDGGYVIRVRDNGVGFDSSEIRRSREGHLGLSSMRERAQMAGGTCEVHSRPGDGTSMECWLPAEAQGAPRLITGSDPRLAERGAA